MAKYIGTKCIVCGETFTESDDIVVCPECGTPYHRGCWDESGCCINTELHEKGESWQPEQPKDEKPQFSTEPIRCIRCGTENAPGTMFCNECGMPLTPNRNAARPFNDSSAENPQNEQYGYQNYNQQNYNQGANGGFGNSFAQGPFGMHTQQVKLTEESDIDGIRLGDFFDYTGRKSLSIIANFVKFAKTGAKSSLNLAALFFPQYYFFYRKMYKEGLLYMLLWLVCVIPSLILYGQSGALGVVLFKMPFDIESKVFLGICDICQLLTTATGIIAGFYANYWYYSKARREITQIRTTSDESETEIRRQIAEAGGTSWIRVIVALTIAAVLGLGILIILTALFQK